MCVTISLSLFLVSPGEWGVGERVCACVTHTRSPPVCCVDRTCCKDWKGEFTLFDLHRMFVTLGLNGIHPYPSVRQYFTGDSWAFNDNTIRDLWGGQATGFRRMESLKQFLRFNDPNELDADDPFGLVRQMLDMFRHRCETAFIFGRHMSLDEVVVGFQGSHKKKDTIKYKREGDGFLLDAVCSSVEGAMATYRPRADAVECLRQDYKRIHESAPELAPLHLRCLGLLDRPCIRGKWRTIWMDNLFTSLRFCYYAHTLTGCHITGLCRARVCDTHRRMTTGGPTRATHTPLVQTHAPLVQTHTTQAHASRPTRSDPHHMGACISDHRWATHMTCPLHSCVERHPECSVAKNPHRQGCDRGQRHPSKGESVERYFWCLRGVCVRQQTSAHPHHRVHGLRLDHEGTEVVQQRRGHCEGLPAPATNRPVQHVHGRSRPQGPA